MNTVPRINPAAAQPVRARDVDPREWETRVDLAACYRLVDLYGMCDLHLNHISARVPGCAAGRTLQVPTHSQQKE
jgi:ribulose-5-phosphate 4-epimerase/fuculose-1-phosphate aldolase